MAVKRKYIDPKYIAMLPFRRDLEATQKEKEELYNKGLIALRSVYKIMAENKRTGFKMLHFNKLVKSKYQDSITDVIRMYLREDEFLKNQEEKSSRKDILNNIPYLKKVFK